MEYISTMSKNGVTYKIADTDARADLANVTKQVETNTKNISNLTKQVEANTKALSNVGNTSSSGGSNESFNFLMTAFSYNSVSANGIAGMTAENCDCMKTIHLEPGTYVMTAFGNTLYSATFDVYKGDEKISPEYNQLDGNSYDSLAVKPFEVTSAGDYKVVFKWNGDGDVGFAYVSICKAEVIAAEGKEFYNGSISDKMF